MIVYIILFFIIIFTLSSIYFFNSRKHYNLNTLLPIFNNKEEFDNSKWKDYYDVIYGKDTVKSSDFPIDTSKLCILYADVLKNTVGININPDNYKNVCPKNENDVYSNMSNDHDIPNTFTLYKLPPYKPIESNIFVEVTHCTDPEVESNENVGAWYYYAPGSGIYFNVGNTKAYNDHNDAAKDLLGIDCDTECVDNFHKCLLLR